MGSDLGAPNASTQDEQCSRWSHEKITAPIASRAATGSTGLLLPATRCIGPSWIRSMDADFGRDVAFFYSFAHESDGLYLDEIQRAAAEHPTFDARIVIADRDGFLTAEKAVAGRPDPAHIWVYMCGPPAMTKALAAGFRRLGIPRARLRWEEFAGR